MAIQRQEQVIACYRAAHAPACESIYYRDYRKLNFTLGERIFASFSHPTIKIAPHVDYFILIILNTLYISSAEELRQ